MGTSIRTDDAKRYMSEGRGRLAFYLAHMDNLAHHRARWESRCCADMCRGVSKRHCRLVAQVRRRGPTGDLAWPSTQPSGAWLLCTLKGRRSHHRAVCKMTRLAAPISRAGTGEGREDSESEGNGSAFLPVFQPAYPGLFPPNSPAAPALATAPSRPSTGKNDTAPSQARLKPSY